MSEYSFITASLVYFASFHHNTFWRDCMFSKMVFQWTWFPAGILAEQTQSGTGMGPAQRTQHHPHMQQGCTQISSSITKKPNCWGAQDTLKGDKSAIKPVLHTSSLSNYWYLGPELFLNERVKAGCFTIRWCINKPRMTNKINKSLSESLSMALKCSCIDIIKMQLFQLLTAPWNVQRWKRNGIKDPNPVAPETLIFIFFPSGFTVGESI